MLGAQLFGGFVLHMVACMSPRLILFRQLATTVVFLVAIYASSVSAATNYVPIALPRGVTMELPRNWEALTSNQRITLDSSVQARTERLGAFDASSDLNFGANLYDEAGKAAAMVNIRYYPDMDVTQADARAATSSDIQELDGGLQTAIAQSIQGTGVKILKWFGTSPRTINGAVAFITEYERSSPNNKGNFRVRLVRVFNGADSFTVTVSYRSRDELLLRPICDRVIGSIKP